MKMRPRTNLRLLRGIALPFLAAIFLPLSSSADDEKVAKQIEKLDTELVKALTGLAKKYDDDKIPEAAHFFASCALGFGGKDEKLAPIKGGWEGSVYLGRMRGGEPIKETAPITGALGSLSVAYKKILDPWIAHARKGGLAESTRKLMLETGIKYEIARGAHEYVQAVQRFNVLRKAMGLRAILWDFEESEKLIQAAWYSGESGHYEYKTPKKESPFYSAVIERADGASWGPHSLKEYPDILRSYVLVRQDLLNPNARQIRLAYWSGGGEIEKWGIYAIPQLPYRPDIPTPTQKFRGETLVQDWVDVEDMVEIKGKKIPYVRYPYVNEHDAPRVFSDGRGGMETGGWAKSEYNFLERAGVPIILRFFAEGTLSDVSTELKDASDTLWPCRIYQDGDKRIDFHRECPTILMLPEKHLDPSVKYTATIRGKLNDTQFEKTWKFATRAN